MNPQPTPADRSEPNYDDQHQDVFVDSGRGQRPWRIHTGPFPLIVPRTTDQMWLWRITNDDHYTAVVVRLAQDVLAPPEELSKAVADAVTTRGHSAIKAAMAWAEPPREITFDDPVGKPTYWGGHP